MAHNTISNLLPPLTAESSILISRIENIGKERVINYCLGTQTKFGILTTTVCCQADEIIIFDIVNLKEIAIGVQSIWMNDDVCLINKPNDSVIIFSNLNQASNCSILIYDHEQEDFAKKDFQFDDSTCSQQSCDLESYVNQNESLLNGSTIICQDSFIFAMVQSGLNLS